MTNSIIIYGSTTGNTEDTANIIEQTLKNKGVDVTTMDVSDADISALDKDYDLYLFGCSTWGDDEIELQEDFVPFYEAMGNYQFANKKVGVFGCGDSSYTYFCGAVDQIEEAVSNNNGVIVNSSLKIDGDPVENNDYIIEWVDEVIASC